MSSMSRRRLVGSLAWDGAAGLWPIGSWVMPPRGERRGSVMP